MEKTIDWILSPKKGESYGKEHGNRIGNWDSAEVERDISMYEL